MKCNQCNKELMITNSTMESEENSTDVYAVQTLACSNVKCINYGGKDLGKATQTVRTKVN